MSSSPWLLTPRPTPPGPAAPDALVTDWRLPGGEDGLDVVRLVRQRA